MEWTQLFPTLNGIVGGIIMALVGWLVGTGRLHLGRETALYKGLWEKEKEKTAKLEGLSDKLTEDLRKTNETLVHNSSTLARANEDLLKVNVELTDSNKRLQENNLLMKTLIERKEGSS